jgi:hypothetical protein
MGELKIKYLLRLSYSQRMGIYIKYKAGWSLLFHHSVRPHPDYLPVMWYKDITNNLHHQIKWGKIINYYFNIFICMIETKPKDITPIKRKGIDMTVKGLQKKYPFIIGYKDDTTTQYISLHYIDLIIDLNKLSEYADVPVNPYWESYVLANPQYEKVYALWSYLEFPNNDLFGDIKDHPGYIIQQKVVEDLEFIYSHLPSQLTLHYTPKSTFFPDDPPTYTVRLKPNAYLMR